MDERVAFLMWCIEATGIALIVGGVVLATGTFAHGLANRKNTFDDAYGLYRRRLGQSILLGLELLVAADIIGTVAVEPTFASVGVLGLIVLVRTFLSMSLEVEMEGRLPWRRRESK